MNKDVNFAADIKRDEAGRPRLLIEEWLPAAAIGVECARERSTGQQPPHARFHVWWARRPLAASRAAVLGSLLPVDFDRGTFERLLGMENGSEHIVSVRRLMDQGVRVDGGFGAQRAFKTLVPEPAYRAMRDGLSRLWGPEVNTLDLFSGGGSIPLESARLGLNSLANELNPVACTVLEASDVYPFTYGLELAKKARKWAEVWIKNVDKAIGQYFPAPASGTVQAYIYARTVPCPDTGYATPLVPDWTLMNPGKDATYASVKGDPATGDWNLQIQQGGVAPSPSYKGGNGISIFTGSAISGDYIKAKAQQGEMGSALYAVATKRPGVGLQFRLPTKDDEKALQDAEFRLQEVRGRWEAEGVLPTENIPAGEKTGEPIARGINTWGNMFSPRQLLSMGTLVDELRSLRSQILATEGEETGLAVEHLLAFSIDKFLNWNAVLTSWNVKAQGLRSVFDRHDFSFKITFAEMAPVNASGGLAWAVDSALSAYEELSTLPRHPQAKPVEIIQGSATNLLSLDDKCVTAVITDPPYDDNVQYSELADFFYVWLKRTQGHRRPEWFSTYLSDHSEEAVVNKKRHQDEGMRPKDAEIIARAFYRDLMMQSFREAHRVLRDDGVLTVMFTHKKQEAWEALFGSLIEAGFTITATWPVQTESKNSLHQAKKNAAQSTVLLVARKRPEGAGIGFYSDKMREEIQRRARESAERLQQLGMSGVDQLVGSFGPAMEVYSRYDAVRTDTGHPITVGQAIDDAAEAVSQWRVDRLAGHALDTLEPEGRFALLCWDVLGAAEFRFNEAKLLGNAVGMDVAQLEAAGLISKSADKITMLSAQARRRDKALEPDEVDTIFGPMPTGKRRTKKDALKVHPNDPSFRTALDGAHALALRYVEAHGGDGGLGSAKGLARQQGWTKDSNVAKLIAALVQAAPEALRSEKSEVGKKYPEFRAWHAMLTPVFDLPAPDWTPKVVAADQPNLFDDADEDDETEDTGEE